MLADRVRMKEEKELLYLYGNGATHVWVHGYNKEDDGSQVNTGEYLKLNPYGGKWSRKTYVTSLRVDITDLKKLCFDAVCEVGAGIGPGISMYFGLLDDKMGNVIASPNKVSGSSTTRRIYELDTSSVSGTFFVAALCDTNYSDYEILKVYNVWGEY